jgi:branched-chain amino acid transport system ATP-binding protein
MSELALEEVTLSFGGMKALDSVSLRVEAGELLALIGPNGAGKTSIFNCISGLYRPTAGRIYFRDHPIIGMRPHQIARLGISRTFQHGELFGDMSVLDNLLAARHVHFRSNPVLEMLSVGSARRQEELHRAAADHIVELFELRPYRDVRVSTLRFALQKIVGFARAIALEPRLLLLDEPSAGLTREEREDASVFIMKIREDLGIGIIWIEHDMQMVADLADRIHVLDYGRSLADGPPDAVLNNSDVIDAYLGVRGAYRAG